MSNNLALLKEQAKDCSLATKQAYINGLEYHMEQSQSNLTALTMTWRTNLETGKEDEKTIEKLQRELAEKDDKWEATCIRWIDRHNALRKAIEDAPHGEGCAMWLDRLLENARLCDCWKADALK